MLNEKYKGLIHPTNIRSQFKTVEEFKAWLDIDFEGTLEADLKECLKAFEKEEMYEDCVIIKDKLNESKSRK